MSQNLPLTFVEYVIDGARQACNRHPFVYLILPLISLINPWNFPMFLITQVIFWGVIYIPVTMVMKKYQSQHIRASRSLPVRSSNEPGMTEEKLQAQRLRCMLIAVGTYMLLYHLGQGIYAYLNCGLLPTLAVEEPLDISDMTVNWAA